MAEWIMKEEKDMDGIDCYIRKGELIRCRNCRHRVKDKTCLRTMKRKPDDGYCDEGEIDEGTVLAKYMAV